MAAIVAGALLALTGCTDKATEKYRDAPVQSRDTTSADVYSMPDGFSNVATKCDQYGNRIYVLFHGDKPYGGITVVPQDPSCLPARARPA